MKDDRHVHPGLLDGNLGVWKKAKSAEATDLKSVVLEGSSPSTPTINNGGCYDNAKRKIKVSENHLRDYNLYEKFSTMTVMWPNKEISDPNGYSPLECFVYHDTFGKSLPCNDILKLRLIEHGKAMVNLQIQMWVDTTFEIPLTLMPSEMKEITKDYPKWVFESYIRQLTKKFRERDGFVPSFVR